MDDSGQWGQRLYHLGPRTLGVSDLWAPRGDPQDGLGVGLQFLGSGPDGPAGSRQELSKITMPIAFNEPLSFLQRITEYMEHVHLIHRASQQPQPLERMQVGAKRGFERLCTSQRARHPPWRAHADWGCSLLGVCGPEPRPLLGPFSTAAHVCVCLCPCVCMYVHVCALVCPVCTRAAVCAGVHMCLYGHAWRVCAHVCMCLHVHMCTVGCVSVCVCVCPYAHACRVCAWLCVCPACTPCACTHGTGKPPSYRACREGQAGQWWPGHRESLVLWV